VLFGAPALAMVGFLITIVVIIASVTFAKSLKHQIPRRREKPRERTFWYRWSRMIQHRPWRFLIGGLAALIVLALPVLSIRLGFGDTGNLPRSRRTPAYDLWPRASAPASTVR
jgi:RND superfamily putative drug exporter